MNEQPKDAPTLYALTPEQVAFIRQIFLVVAIQGNRQQVIAILTKMADVEAALSSPVENKDKQ